MFSRFFCCGSNTTEYKPMERLFYYFPTVWLKLEVSIVLDTRGQAFRHSLSSIEESPYQEVRMGTITLTDRTRWLSLDKTVLRKFDKFMCQTYPYRGLGLSASSVLCYKVGSASSVPPHRIPGTPVPRKAPLDFVGRGPTKLRIFLKGASQEGAVDGLAFQTHLRRDACLLHLQQVMSRRMILFQADASMRTCDQLAFILEKIADFLDCVGGLGGRPSAGNEVIVFNCTGTRANAYRLRALIEETRGRCQAVRRERNAGKGAALAPGALPYVVVIQNLQELCPNLGEVADAFLKFHWTVREVPYVIASFVHRDR